MDYATSLAAARRIRVARAYAGITQHELARALGVKDQTIKRREQGTHPPRPGELERIAAICGLSVAFMTGEADEPAAAAGEIRDILSALDAKIDRVLAAIASGDE